MKSLTIFCLLSCSVSVAFAQAADLKHLGETNPLAALTGNRFHGTWVGTTLGPTPQVVNFERTGTFVWQSAFEAGGYSLNENSFSMIQGSWQRSGPRSLKMLGVRFVYGPDDRLLSVERARGTLQFGDDFSTLHGEANLEEILCEDVQGPPPFDALPTCPDATTAPADVLRGPFVISLKRLDVDAGDQ